MDDLRLDLIPLVKRLALSRNEKHPWAQMSDMDFFRSAGLYEENKMTGEKGFNLAGILLFGRDDVICSCTVGAITDCLLRKENLDRYDDRLIVETNLIEAFDRIYEFIEKHTLDRFFIIGNQNVSVRSHIAREIVSNILAHREYTSSYRARLIIEQNRIITDNWSRPQFEGRIDPDDFTPHSKNPILAKFFVNIGRADELGSGVRNLYKYTDIYTGGAEPELIEGNVFKMIVPLVNLSNKEVMIGFDTDTVVDGKFGEKFGEKQTKEKIIKIMQEEPTASAKTIGKMIEITTRAVEKNIRELKAVGLIERVGAAKGGYWVVKQKK